MFKTKKEKLAAIGLIIMLLAALAAYLVFVPGANAGAKSIKVTVNHLDGTVNSFEIKTDAEYLRQALEERGLISGKEDQYGLWIETVDGETADSAKQQWWGYTVNGEFAAYGVDGQVVTDGDNYEFTLNAGY